MITEKNIIKGYTCDLIIEAKWIDFCTIHTPHNNTGTWYSVIMNIFALKTSFIQLDEELKRDEHQHKMITWGDNMQMVYVNDVNICNNKLNTGIQNKC